MTMLNRVRRRRAVTGVAAGVLVTGALAMGGPTAVAQDGDGGEAGIDLSVEITELTEPGALTMTVAPHDGVLLSEDGSDADARQFVGATPTVTVSDTRSAEEIPEGAYWAVVGQAGDFTDAVNGNSFGPEYLGWSPRLLTSSPSGSVSAGEPVSSVIEDGSGADPVGLGGQELLISSYNSADETGTWDVGADLTLRTPVDVQDGTYSSTLTLSLFEQN